MKNKKTTMRIDVELVNAAYKCFKETTAELTKDTNVNIKVSKYKAVEFVLRKALKLPKKKG